MNEPTERAMSVGLDTIHCQTLVYPHVSLLDYFPIFMLFYFFFFIPCVYTLLLSPQHERQHILRVSMTCILVQPWISFSVSWLSDRGDVNIPPVCLFSISLTSLAHLLPPNSKTTLWGKCFWNLDIDILYLRCFGCLNPYIVALNKTQCLECIYCIRLFWICTLQVPQMWLHVCHHTNF